MAYTASSSIRTFWREDRTSSKNPHTMGRCTGFVFLYIRAVIAAVRPKMMPGTFATTIGHSGFLRKSP